jgi:hypothetical protein
MKMARNPPSSPSPSSITYRRRAARSIPGTIGVYALCDLDGVPIYVGQSTDGIRQRVNRHITSARSDIIANRLVDVWEIAYVKCWPVAVKAHLDLLEAYLFHKYHPESALMNGSVPREVRKLEFKVPEPQTVQLMADEEIKDRLRVELRLPRQAKQFGDLLDQFLTVKDSRELYLALQAHFGRLQKYFQNLRPGQNSDIPVKDVEDYF